MNENTSPVALFGSRIFVSIFLLTAFCFARISVMAQIPRFLDAPQYPTAGFVEAVAVGDFNGDGIADLATCGVGDSRSTVSILLGNGDGSFQAHRDFNTGVGPTGIAVGDFNGDGKLDL